MNNSLIYIFSELNLVNMFHKYWKNST